MLTSLRSGRSGQNARVVKIPVKAFDCCVLQGPFLCMTTRPFTMAPFEIEPRYDMVSLGLGHF